MQWYLKIYHQYLRSDRSFSLREHLGEYRDVNIVNDFNKLLLLASDEFENTCMTLIEKTNDNSKCDLVTCQSITRNSRNKNSNMLKEPYSYDKDDHDIVREQLLIR